VFQELAEKVDAPVHVDGSDERNEFEEELARLEGEQERAVPENLLQRVRNSPADQGVGVLDVLEDEGVQLVVVERVLVQLRHAYLERQIAVHFFLLLFFIVAVDDEL